MTDEGPVSALRARIQELERNSYPHMCRDGHQQIGHSDSECEMCPVCCAVADRDRAVAAVEVLRDALREIATGTWNRKLPDPITVHRRANIALAATAEYEEPAPSRKETTEERLRREGKDVGDPRNYGVPHPDEEDGEP